MKLAFVFGIVALAGCAKPEYISAPGPNAGQEDKDSVSATCDLQFPVSKLCVSWRWTIPPDERTAGTMLVKTWHPNGADGSPVMIDVPALGLYINMDMPHPPRVATVTQKDVGTYSLSNLFFSMHGKWYLNFQLKDASGNVSENLKSVIYF